MTNEQNKNEDDGECCLDEFILYIWLIFARYSLLPKARIEHVYPIHSIWKQTSQFTIIC